MAKAPPPSVPAVRPTRPPYIEAFEHFTTGKDDQIEALVAFGLFVTSDYTYASKLPAWPSEEKIRDNYTRMLNDSEVQNFQSAAKKIIDDNREFLVREHQKKYL